MNGADSKGKQGKKIEAEYFMLMKLKRVMEGRINQRKKRESVRIT
jgi:hypothetical protein